jgi:hypothetical protein
VKAFSDTVTIRRIAERSAERIDFEKRMEPKNCRGGTSGVFGAA